ncbi:MAG: hypothetical protein ACJAWY_003528, partial [Sphingomonas echinoides]
GAADIGTIRGANLRGRVRALRHRLADSDSLLLIASGKADRRQCGCRDYESTHANLLLPP